MEGPHPRRPLLSCALLTTGKVLLFVLGRVRLLVKPPCLLPVCLCDWRAPCSSDLLGRGGAGQREHEVSARTAAHWHADTSLCHPFSCGHLALERQDTPFCLPASHVPFRPGARCSGIWLRATGRHPQPRTRSCWMPLWNGRARAASLPSGCSTMVSTVSRPLSAVVCPSTVHRCSRRSF